MIQSNRFSSLQRTPAGDAKLVEELIDMESRHWNKESEVSDKPSRNS
jgi:hypothetical protein